VSPPQDTCADAARRRRKFLGCEPRQERPPPRLAKLARSHTRARTPASLRLQRPVHERLKLYAEFIQSPKDYVVSQALTWLFRKDKDFATWLEARTAPSVSTALNVPETSEPSTHATTRLAISDSPTFKTA
jgi:hypothetical protein